MIRVIGVIGVISGMDKLYKSSLGIRSLRERDREYNSEHDKIRT